MNRLEVMERVAKRAGEFMRGSSDRGQTEKSNAKDFVTVADIKAQNIIREELTKIYPNVVVLSEEDDEEKRQAMSAADFTGYILDPIDGTYNFKRDMQESAISIGYVENGEPVAGVIFDPYKNELYKAEKGHGAFRNGQKIHVSNQSQLAGSSIATSNSYDDEAMARSLKRHLAIYEQTGTMPWTSCPGSGVLIMAWVACGRIDAYHHNGLKPWDNAAAFLLVQEAGGVVLDLEGNRTTYTNSRVLLGNKAIVEELTEVFRNIEKELLT